ncbi:MAG: hypothetical protein H6Q89_736 [Myxococcaceae bacterium]|nr:hypothetical protein [Myxococcaceae bacterium]
MTPAEFAQLATGHLRARGMAREIRFDAARFCLVVEGEGGLWRFCFLHHGFNEFKAAAVHEREKVLQRRLWSLLDNGAIPPRDEVLKGVLPRVRDCVYHAVLERQLAAQVDDVAERALLEIPYRHLNEELEVNAVFDLPTSAMDVTASRLSTWGMTLAELEQRALDNLRLRSKEPFRLVAPGLWASPWGDGHDAARMLLSDEISRLKVLGEHVAMIPSASVLMIAGSEDAHALASMAEIARDAVQDPRAITGITFKRAGDGWQAWLPPHDSPAYDKLYFLALQSRANAYTQQKELLDAWYEYTGESQFVSRFSAFRTDAGDIYTCTPWTEQVDGLLPRTDRIDFVKLVGEGESKPKVWPAKFEIALEVVGHLLTRTDERPERWKTKGFPTEAELALMTERSGLEVATLTS